MRLIFVVLLIAAISPTQKPRMLILGDSLARGAYASNPAATYAARLSAVLDSIDQTIVRGDVRRLESAEEGWQAEATGDWDIVILEIGINDTLYPTITDDMAWAQRYAELAKRISQSGARLICVTPFDVDIQQSAMMARAEMIRVSCAGGRIADVWASSQGHSELRAVPGSPTWYNHNDGVANDSLHPNDSGHALIARVILDALTDHTYLPMVQR